MRGTKSRSLLIAMSRFRSERMKPGPSAFEPSVTPKQKRDRAGILSRFVFRRRSRRLAILAGRYCKVLRDEVGWIGAIRENAADPGSSEKNVVRALFVEKIADGRLVSQVQLAVGSREKVTMPVRAY